MPGRYSREQKAGLRTSACLEAASCSRGKRRPGRQRRKKEKQSAAGKGARGRAAAQRPKGVFVPYQQGQGALWDGEGRREQPRRKKREKRKEKNTRNKRWEK